jgi:hypothetical protein
MGDLKPAPMILARPLPVSTADSMLSARPGPGVAGLGDAVPLLERNSAAEIELARWRWPSRSREGDRDPWADSANA